MTEMNTTIPAGALADWLSAQVMNLRTRMPANYGSDNEKDYKTGHRDARHDAVELILQPVADLERQRDEAVAACKAWVDYFDWLDQRSEPGDPLNEARRKQHAKRLDACRSAIAAAEQRTES